MRYRRFIGRLDVALRGLGAAGFEAGLDTPGLGYVVTHDRRHVSGRLDPLSTGAAGRRELCDRARSADTGRQGETAPRSGRAMGARQAGSRPFASRLREPFNEKAQPPDAPADGRLQRGLDAVYRGDPR